MYWMSGRGDAVLLCQDGSYCLIDTGPAEAEDALLYDLQTLDVETLDYLVLTHPPTRTTPATSGRFYRIFRLLPCCCRAGSPTARKPQTGRAIWQTTPQTAVREIITAAAGDSFPLGSGTLDILQGGSDDADNVNDASLCTLFTAGDFRFLDTGDAEEAAEQRLLDTYGATLHATLFKAGHHGSYTSNSLAFLQAVRPGPWPSAAVLITITATRTAPRCKILTRSVQRSTALTCREVSLLSGRIAPCTWKPPQTSPNPRRKNKEYTMTITEQFKAKRCVFSIECFPPKQTTQMDKLKDTLRQMQALNPGFISVTFGAGGSAGGVSTVEVADYLQNELSVPTMAHLICMGNDETRAAAILDQLEAVGVRDVLAPAR